MGLGLHGGGIGVAKFFCKHGAELLVTDLKTEEQLAESLKKLKGCKMKLSLGGHKEEDFLWPDLIIKNPDVPFSSPFLKIAADHNIPVETDVSLFFKYSRAFVIGVTGTKGKTTTASLIYHFVKSKYKDAFLAGNIGVSPLDLIGKVKKSSKVILELSSFELEGLQQSPQIAVVTNLMADHLNRYPGMKEYIEAKKTIFKHQNKKNYLILNEDDSIVRQFVKEAKSKIIYYSASKKPCTFDLSKFRLKGSHNIANLSAAVEVGKILKIPVKEIQELINTFKGVPHRQQMVGNIGGVRFYNDTAATMPDAVIAAINTFKANFPAAKMILICGGQNKGLSYEMLAKKIKNSEVFVIMLPGTASDKIKENLGDYRVVNVLSMAEAVKKAKEIAKKGDAVVLSPGAASFNLFKNEFDRGRQFVEAVKSLAKNEKKD